MTYGTAREARLDWKIRHVTKDIFKYPLDVVGQNIENIIDECVSREKSPVVCQIYCDSEVLIIEDFIGMTPDDVENNYVTFGVSGKCRVFGRYGHGGKDTALAVAGYFHLLSRLVNQLCAFKIWEDENLVVRYSPAWGLESLYSKQKDGTLIIIPNTRHFTLEEIKEYLLKNFFLGLVEEKIIIGLGENYGSRTEILQAELPSYCEIKPVQIQFEKDEIEKYCSKHPLKLPPEVRGFYLVPKEGFVTQPAYNIYSYGKYITGVPTSINVAGYFGMDFLLETTELTASKDLKLGRQSLYQKHLLPKLMEWEKSNLGKLKETENELEFIQEIETLLGPLFGGSKKQTKRKRRLKQIKRPVEFKVQTAPNPGQTPGHGKLNLIDEPGEPLVVGIQLPDKIFINKGSSDGKYIWTLDRRTKKILLYSRAANFLPFVQKSKSGTLITSAELNTIREDALKSQEFWMNAIRRDHGEKQEVRYLGNKRVTVQK